MSKAGIGASIAIAVALIGAAATLGGAYIQRPREPLQPTASPAAAAQSHIETHPTTYMSITGVRIGRTSDEVFVIEPRTVFGTREAIAATVRFRATEGIQNFPARLSATLGNPLFGQMREEQIADISTTGESFWTFNFPPQERAPGTYLFTVQLNGVDAYDQTINIK